MKPPAEPTAGQPFDAADFARPLAEGEGLVWDDPREIHSVAAVFEGPVPENPGLEYWRCRWPQVRLPKDHVEGRGSSGWWQLGDWYNGQWQTADAQVSVDGNRATFSFRPLCAHEFPELQEFPVTFRTTTKVRLTGTDGQSPVQFLAHTDSTLRLRTVTVMWADAGPKPPRFEVFNGWMQSAESADPNRTLVRLWCTENTDPHTFDGTLLTIATDETVTVALQDVAAGPVWVPHLGLCVVPGEDARDYAGVCAEMVAGAQPCVYDMVARLPEQTWQRAWTNMVPKRGLLSLPLAADGGRHKFGLQPDGSLRYRTNNEVLLTCRGADSARLQQDADSIHLSLGLPAQHRERTIQEGILPIGLTLWDTPEGTIEQVAFATVLGGTDPAGPAPEADAFGVCLMRLSFSGSGRFTIPLTFEAGDATESVTVDDKGMIWAGDKLRAALDTGDRGEIVCEDAKVAYSVELDGASHSITLRVPYVWLLPEEIRRLQALDFDREREAVAGYWRRMLKKGMALVSPEPELSEFHAAVAAHSLINAELEPGARRRFARAGSFTYLAYGNESCMMIVDLDRRGLHDAARECLEGFLQYQGSVQLPGDFRSQEGVLWGSAGYEHGGYNQHHGWILWCLIEHFRFTRDDAWLASVADKVLAASDWIIRERDRALPADSPEAGLLPPGNLEDITDWWPWISTNCYTWRGLDAAAWGLGQIGHPRAEELQAHADDYRRAILDGFTRAARRSPVVRLRDGTYVPHFPSHVYRRGRTFGWICETLEGAIHLLISGLLQPGSREAGWILRDFEDNLYLSEQYGYSIQGFAEHWFDWGGFSMQACLLLDVEPYLYRDDVKHALRAAFNALAANFYPDTRMAAEHALPELGDWAGDHYKSPDEANACGWLRYLFAREDGDRLLLGQAVPTAWLRPGCRCGIERAATHFGEMSLIFEAGDDRITAHLDAPVRNPPAQILLRFRPPAGQTVASVRVDGEVCSATADGWVVLPGDIGKATVTARLGTQGRQGA